MSEQRQQQNLRDHGLQPRRKLLLVGPPGSGKTMTAAVLAGELHLPLFTIVLDGLITKFMGETAAKLRLVFDAMQATRGVYFFDEFDAIGARRGERQDVGEIRRVLNSFLQFLEQDESHGLIVAATNHPELLDKALFRRFDDVIEYSVPDAVLAEALLRARLDRFDTRGLAWSRGRRAGRRPVAGRDRARRRRCSEVHPVAKWQADHIGSADRGIDGAPTRLAWRTSSGADLQWQMIFRATARIFFCATTA